MKAVGASTHHCALVKGLIRLKVNGFDPDVCHPLYNMAGIGIADGGEEDMASALRDAHAMGIGVFAMKALGGGHLCGRAEDALRFVLDKPYIDAAAVGMQSFDEVDANIALLTGGTFSEDKRARLGRKHRTLHVEDYCEGCGACVRRCGEGALKLVPASECTDDAPGHDFSADFAENAGITGEDAPKMRAVPDDEKCVRCGYCTKVCPVFALKVY